MTTITREEIELAVVPVIDVAMGDYGSGHYEEDGVYNALSHLLGHDLAELCRLGKAVLEQYQEDVATYGPFAADGLKPVFERAGVERPET